MRNGNALFRNQYPVKNLFHPFDRNELDVLLYDRIDLFKG